MCHVATIIFKVTDVNDLSSDGPQVKRVVLEAAPGEYDGTGAKDLPTGAFVSGRLEIVMSNDLQTAHFPIGSKHALGLAVVRPKTVKARRRSTAKRAKTTARKKR